MTAQIDFITSHGTFALSALDGERVYDLLHRHQIPWTAVATYLKKSGRSESFVFPSLHLPIDSLDADHVLSIIYQRNINPFEFAQPELLLSPPKDLQQPVTEYVYADYLNGGNTIIRQLSVDECKDAVATQVHEMLSLTLPASSSPIQIVVGVSGGGDSNALLSAMATYRGEKHSVEVLPVIICGPGEWNSGVPRAKAICESFGLSLTIVSEDESAEILGVTDRETPLMDRFARAYPGEDYEAMGTLIIRLCLARVAKQHSARYICTGLNLEDLLAETLLRYLQIAPPIQFPARPIDGLTLLYPLWLLPKKIIDGCYPKFAYDNYHERYPSHVRGRALCYQLAYHITSNFPGIGEKLLRSASMIAEHFPHQAVHDDELGFEIDKSANSMVRERFRRFLRG